MKSRRYHRALALLFAPLAVALHGCAPSAIASRPQQLPRDFVSLAEIDAGVALDLRYATANNFVGVRIDGYDAAKCLLTRAAANALARVQRDLRVEGLGLVVLDCYRPQRAVDHFVRWSPAPDDPRAKARYYPRVEKSESRTPRRTSTRRFANSSRSPRPD